MDGSCNNMSQNWRLTTAAAKTLLIPEEMPGLEEAFLDNVVWYVNGAIIWLYLSVKNEWVIVILKGAKMLPRQ